MATAFFLHHCPDPPFLGRGPKAQACSPKCPLEGLRPTGRHSPVTQTGQQQVLRTQRSSGKVLCPQPHRGQSVTSPESQHADRASVIARDTRACVCSAVCVFPSAPSGKSRATLPDHEVCGGWQTLGPWLVHWCYKPVTWKDIHFQLKKKWLGADNMTNIIPTNPFPIKNSVPFYTFVSVFRTGTISNCHLWRIKWKEPSHFPLHILYRFNFHAITIYYFEIQNAK